MSYLTFIYKVEAIDYIIKNKTKDIHKRRHEYILNALKKYSSKATEL